MVYGANGFTGRLAVAEAIRRGLRPVLAGRSAEPVRALAARHGLPARIFALDDPAEVARGIADAAVVLHCAGPFVRTAAPMLDACIAAGAHYADVAGEIPALEDVFARDARAREAGIVALPGAGFDVVPTDCLAAALHTRLPDATSLHLALASRSRQSAGTWRATLEAVPRGNFVRRGGELVSVPHARRIARVRFDDRPRWTMTIPWGDLVTAYRSTGIPDIEVQFATSPAVAAAVRLLSPFRRLFAPRTVQVAMWRTVRAVGGLLPAARTGDRSAHIRGDAWNAAGERRALWLVTPEPYRFTARTAVECAMRLAAGGVSPGAHTPATAFGEGFVREFEGVRMVEVELSDMG